MYGLRVPEATSDSSAQSRVRHLCIEIVRKGRPLLFNTNSSADAVCDGVFDRMFYGMCDDNDLVRSPQGPLTVLRRLCCAMA